MDRMDIFVDVPPVSITDLRGGDGGEDSASVRARVERAHAIQYARNGQGRLNVALTTDEIEKYCSLTADANAFFDTAIEKLKLSARGYYRVLKVARTIADLDGGAPEINKTQIAEALSYRPKTY